jgi:hypothetical protein
MLTIEDWYDGQLLGRYDLHSLKLPDGQPAFKLPADDLRRELVFLDVDGILPSDGHQQLLIAYARHLKRKEI